MGNIESDPYYSVANEKITTFLLKAKQENVINPFFEYHKQYENDTKEALVERKEKDDIFTRMCLMSNEERFSLIWNRQMLIPYFGYAIPDPQALLIIQEYTLKGAEQPRRVIEIGSGTGYWTFLLRQQGNIVDAVDTMEEFKQEDRYWIKDTIQKDGKEYLKETNSKESVLLLVWPRCCEDFLVYFQGEYVILVGERDGCTGIIHEWSEEQNCDFCEGECKSVWEEEKSYQIPTWPGFHDIMMVFCRRKI